MSLQTLVISWAGGLATALLAFKLREAAAGDQTASPRSREATGVLLRLAVAYAAAVTVCLALAVWAAWHHRPPAQLASSKQVISVLETVLETLQVLRAPRWLAAAVLAVALVWLVRARLPATVTRWWPTWIDAFFERRGRTRDVGITVAALLTSLTVFGSGLRKQSQALEEHIHDLEGTHHLLVTKTAIALAKRTSVYLASIAVFQAPSVYIQALDLRRTEIFTRNAIQDELSAAMSLLIGLPAGDPFVAERGRVDEAVAKAASRALEQVSMVSTSDRSEVPGRVSRRALDQVASNLDRPDRNDGRDSTDEADVSLLFFEEPGASTVLKNTLELVSQIGGPHDGPKPEVLATLYELLARSKGLPSTEIQSEAKRLVDRAATTGTALDWKDLIASATRFARAVEISWSVIEESRLEALKLRQEEATSRVTAAARTMRLQMCEELRAVRKRQRAQHERLEWAACDPKRGDIDRGVVQSGTFSRCYGLARRWLEEPRRNGFEPILSGPWGMGLPSTGERLDWLRHGVPERGWALEALRARLGPTPPEELDCPTAGDVLDLKYENLRLADELSGQADAEDQIEIDYF